MEQEQSLDKEAILQISSRFLLGRTESKGTSELYSSIYCSRKNYQRLEIVLSLEVKGSDSIR